MGHLLYLQFIPKKKYEQVVEDNFGNSTVCILPACWKPCQPFPSLVSSLSETLEETE